jgi:hypothetical protein
LKIGKRAARGFVLIDPPGYRSAAALAKWIEYGLAVAKARRAPPAKRPVPPRRRAVK